MKLVRATIMKCRPDIVVLQETKKESISNRLVKWSVDRDLSKWCAIPTVGTAGGVLCAWNPKSLETSQFRLSLRILILMLVG